MYPIEDMVYNNKNSGKRIREMVLRFDEFDPEEILESVEALEDTLNVEKYIGVIFANNFTMAQFKAQLHLLAGNDEEALALLEYGSDKRGHLVAELIRMRGMELEWEEYEAALFSVFGRERVLEAVRIANAEAYLIDVSLHPHYEGMLGLYERLEEKKKGVASR